MLGAGPPRDGIIRTSPGQECSKDKGALPGARRIFVYAARFWSTAGPASTVWFKPYRLVLHLDEKRVSLYPAKRHSARSSMDRASDYGSEGWGFESLRARSGPPRCDPPVGVLHFYQALPSGVLFSCPFRDCHGPSESVSCSARDEGSPAVSEPDWRRNRTRPARFLPNRPATKFALLAGNGTSWTANTQVSGCTCDLSGGHSE